MTQVNADYLEGTLTARFIVSAKATDAGSGNWDYEYAVRNFNSHRSGQAFSVPLADAAPATSIGFHDVPWHSGDGDGSVNYDGTDWPTARSAGRLTWSTQTYAQNPSANALRWGTQYNFRFRTTSPPTTGSAAITLFRPGAAGEPAEILIPGLPVPGIPACPADFNNSDSVSVQDIFDFIAAYFAGDTASDFNRSGAISVQDIFDFLAAYFTPCG